MTNDTKKRIVEYLKKTLDIDARVFVCDTYNEFILKFVCTQDKFSNIPTLLNANFGEKIEQILDAQTTNYSDYTIMPDGIQDTFIQIVLK